MVDMRTSENIDFWAATDVGMVRDHNEDNFLVDKSLKLFVVADGMGGHAAGEVASAIAVNAMRDVIKKNNDLIEAFKEGSRIASNRDISNLLEHAVQEACAEIFKIAQDDPEKRGMGTTLSSLLVLNNRGFIAHVGDSRIYLLRGGRVVRLTEDHSLVNELIKRGKLSESQAETSPYKNAVTRAVGVYESVEVDTIDFDVLPGDYYIIASDGLTGYLQDKEISNIVSNTGGDIKLLPQAFINLANERGGKDNITNIVVHIYDEDGEGNALSREVNLKIETIRKMPLFKYLTYKELVKIMNITEMEETASGTTIIKEGKSGEDLYIVLSGTVSVHKGEKKIVELSDGDHFGEMALVDKAPRSADITALTDTKLLKMSRGDFFQIIRKEPQLASKLLWSFVQVLSSRLRKTNQEIRGTGDGAAYEDLTAELFQLPSTPPVPPIPRVSFPGKKTTE